MIGMTHNEELDILEIVYQGDIALNDILEYGKKIKDNKYLPRNLKMITDATKANYLFSLNEIQIISHALKENTKHFESVKSAMLQSKPIETAKSMIMQQENVTLHYQHKIFYTRTAALKWLLQD